MIKIITVGKVRRKELTYLINSYLNRIPRKLKLIEIKDEPKIENIDIEGSKILKHIKDNEYVITLEIKGKELDSLEFAKLINKIELNHTSNITFIIGGSFGLSNLVTNRSNFKLSFSKLTYPHQLMKLILSEQIYRAYSILNNHPYHK